MRKRRHSHSRSSAARANLVALGAAAFVSIGACAVVVTVRRDRRAGVARAAVVPVPQAALAPAPADLAKIKANELGRIPILMYHSVGDAPSRAGLEARIQRMGLNISPALFRKHLQLLLDSGFYPVNMREVFSPKFEVPAGKMPVVLTFDDARGSQFRYRKDGSIDPNCAVAILEAFHDAHPDDWPAKASFYVLPLSKYNPVPFFQRGLEKKKIQFLVAHGYEVANHSTSHRPMARMDAKTLEWEMANCARYFHDLDPSATMDTMALPYGIPPAKGLLSVLITDGKGDYDNKCILLAAGNPSYAPADSRFDKLRVTRIGSEPGNIELWIRTLKAARNAPPAKANFRPYVSDGDPNTLAVPESLVKRLDKTRLGQQKLIVWSDITPPASKPRKIPVAIRPTPTAPHQGKG